MTPETPSTVEFAVQIKGSACIESVKLRMKEIGVKQEHIETVVDSENKECRMVIRTTRPWIELQETIEKTGRRSVLVGFSDEAAVAMLDKGDRPDIKGVIRFCSITADKPGIVIDGVIDGLSPKEDHTLDIREFGDVSEGFASLGNIFRNSSYKMTSDGTGRATIRSVDKNLHVHELIGRSVAVSSSSGTNFVCGIISRAAGVFQNWKRICACDGLTIWDERDRPLAGAGRRIND